MILPVSDEEGDLNQSGRAPSAAPLRNKLVLTLAAALTPVLLLSAFKAYIDARDIRDSQAQNLVLVAGAAIDGVNQSLQQAELLLSLYEPRLAAGECSGVYNELSVYLPSLTNVVAFDENSEVICSAVGTPALSRENQVLHDRLRAGGDSFARSDAFFGSASDEWVFALNKRVEDEAGNFTGINTFALGAIDLANLVRAGYLPDYVSLSIADETGRVFGDPLVGPIPAEWIEGVRRAQDAQLFRVDHPDGTSVDVVLRPVGNSNIFAVIARPSYGLWNDFFVRPATSFGLPLLAFAVTLLAAWMAIDGLVLRWISRLTRTVRIYGAGRYQFKAGNSFVDAPSEIRSLATAMEVMAQDIDHRDRDLKEAIATRDAAVKEIHHRVKNNLQIVTSFLNLQGRQLKDPQAKEAIAATRHRIDALAIVHQTLYQNERLESVDMRPFLTGLLNHLSDALGMSEAGISLVQSYAEIQRDADDAIPMALFIVEAVTNAMKYAFEEDGGEVSVCLSATDDQVTLEIRDTGLGYDSTDGSSGLGSKLMIAFARQLSAEFTTEARPGLGCSHKLVMPF
ncbi:MAG: sensor histidine kinase [Hyphomonas sp.]|uniref:sensor histidine kinase n=1 Tax=Hyphomonas sp. TaxID=87 RepID=UPI00326430BB